MIERLHIANLLLLEFLVTSEIKKTTHDFRGRLKS
jgi:hypothetical protein